MRLVPKATLFHAQCSVTRSANGPMVDMEQDFDMDHQGRWYISVSAVRDLGALIGLVDREEVQAQADRADEAEQRVVALEGELERARVFKGALDVIESEGFRARKKSGRPKAAAA